MDPLDPRNSIESLQVLDQARKWDGLLESSSMCYSQEQGPCFRNKRGMVDRARIYSEDYRSLIPSGQAGAPGDLEEGRLLPRDSTLGGNGPGWLRCKAYPLFDAR